ncbi:MAG: endonuclease/exonuclease/phosphatase family protein [Alphaproteobacteria bacterium]
MKVVTYNIQWSKGRDGQLDLGRIARAVDGADIIGLQEVEAGWKRSGGIDQAEALGALLPNYFRVYGPGFDVEASRVRPDGAIEHRRRRFGNMILAKGPILSCRVFPLPKIDVRALGTMQTAVVEGVVQLGARAIRVYCVHLDDVLARERHLQIAALRRILDEAPPQGGMMTGTAPPNDPYLDEDWHNGEPQTPMPASAIVMGDFNAPPATTEYDALIGPSDPRQGRVVTPDFLVDTMTASGHPEDCGATWHPYANRSSEAPKRIDYVFVTADLAGSVRRAWIDHEAQGSDHLPVWAEIDDQGV